MSAIATRLAQAKVASCGCGTKTNDPNHHAESCRYRILCLAETEIAALRAENETAKNGLSVANVFLREAADERDYYRTIAGELGKVLGDAQTALAICYADSHYVRVEWLRDNGHEQLALVIENIRKHSGSHHNAIKTTLARYNEIEKGKK